MILRKLFVWLLVGILLMGTSCKEEEPIQRRADPTALSVPVVEYAVSGRVADVSWSIPEQVKSVRYSFELYADDAEVPVQSATTFSTSQRFELKSGVVYRFRVYAVAPLSFPEWADSPFSEYVSFSSEIPKVNVELPVANEDDGILRAFPGAEGGGMYATGGRGGKVYHVSNLNDSGAGSLREAVEASGKRIVVFDVAGTIVLKSELTISNNDITIAGQTAPGDGICLRDYTVRIDADNVIIRYLRFRLGNATANTADPQDNTICGSFHENIILDHCSISWAMNECALFYANRNFTMQWCLLSEGLNKWNSAPGAKAYGYGGTLGGKNASFHHNMLAHNPKRNPCFDFSAFYMKDSEDYSEEYRGHVDFRNNVIYNWGESNVYGGADGAFNMVNNFYKPGPKSWQNIRYFIEARWYNPDFKIGENYPQLYLTGNYFDKEEEDIVKNLNQDNWNGGVKFMAQNGNIVKPTDDVRLNAPLSIMADDAKACYTTTHTSAEAFNVVLSYAGTSLKRDAVDLRIETDVRMGIATYANGGNGSTGGFVDYPSAVGGWPELSATDEEKARAAVDTDADGIPDYYEELFELDPKDASDAMDKTLDPQGIYPNIEVYFHYLVRSITAGQTSGGIYTALN